MSPKLEAAPLVVASFPDGGRFVGLAPVTDPDLVLPTIVLGTFLLTTGEPLLMQADVEIGGTDSAGSGSGGVDTGRPTIFEMP